MDSHPVGRLGRATSHLILDGTWLFLDDRWDRPARTFPRGDYFFIMFFALKFEWCETIFAFVYILVIRNSKHLN